MVIDIVLSLRSHSVAAVNETALSLYPALFSARILHSTSLPAGSSQTWRVNSATDASDISTHSLSRLHWYCNQNLTVLLHPNLALFNCACF